jgi:hypothetical protein
MQSEKHHRRVIELKERIGCSLFEVHICLFDLPHDSQIASSKANLGSLLTFDLLRHQDAIDLLMESSHVTESHLGAHASGLSCMSFGILTVPGLQFHYRSLMNAYMKLDNMEMFHRFQSKLDVRFLLLRFCHF